MVRTRSESRLDRILDAALYAFIDSGYAGTTLQEVATRAEVSVGSVYSYCSSKEALFELVLRGALGEPTPTVDDLPFKGIRNTDLISWVWERLQAIAVFPELAAAAAHEPVPEDPMGEVERVIREIWAWQSRYWRAIELIERCAREWPELHMLYFKQFRRGAFQQGAELLERRMRQGVIRRYPDAATALRVVVENIAFFAMHRHVRPDSAYLDEEMSRETVVAMMLAAFTPDGTTSPGAP